MLQYYYYNSAIIVYICTIYLFYVKEHIKDNQSRFFEIMLWAGLAASVFDIFSGEAIRNIEKLPIWSFYLILSIYFLVQNSIPLLFSLYGLTLVGRQKKLTAREKILIYTPALITAILILSNHWTKLVFYIDDNGNYTNGIGFVFLLIQTAYYLILNILYSSNYKKYIAARIRYMLIIGSAAIMIIILLDTMLFNIMIHNLCVSICMFLLFVIIQNSEEDIVNSSGLLTNYALLRQSQLDLINNCPFTILLIKLEDKAIINYTFGLNSWIALLNKVSDYLKSLGKLQKAYNLEDGLYAIMFRHDYPLEEKERLIKSIESEFKSSQWDVSDTKLSISVQMLELSYPGDIREINDISYYINYYNLNMVNVNRSLLTVADLNLQLKEQRKVQVNRLWDIIESSQYELCFMPIYCVSENRIIAREPRIKLAMDPPVYVSPRDLDYLTEDYRQLNRLHKKIFDDICIYLKDNPTEGDNMEYVNVSLPVTQMMQEDFAEQYSSILRKHMVDFNRIRIEMSTVMDFYSQPVIEENILKLSNYGVTFILDQYGTGYSSPGYFKDIHFEYVKLDKSVVRTCLENEKGLAILNGIIAMMNRLKVTIIADGVDSKEMADLLISIGIDNLEGTYYL